MKKLLSSILLIVLLFSSPVFASSRIDHLINLAVQVKSQQGTYNSSKYVIIVDFSLPSSEKRLYIINTESRTIVFSTYCAHGVNSGGEYATSFSNEEGSLKSSLGVYMTSGTYQGHNGTSIKLRGLTKGKNDNAESRRIVIHGAWYSRDGKGGRSWGCFAVPPEDMSRLIDLCGSGVLLDAVN